MRLARGFSRQREISQFATASFAPRHASDLRRTGFAWPDYLGRLDAAYQRRAWPTLLRLPVTQTALKWYWNLNQLSIAYAFRPRLRTRLTLSGQTFLRKPWAFGEQVSHLSLVTHAGILTSQQSTALRSATSYR